MSLKSWVMKNTKEYLSRIQSSTDIQNTWHQLKVRHAISYTHRPFQIKLTKVEKFHSDEKASPTRTIARLLVREDRRMEANSQAVHQQRLSIMMRTLARNILMRSLPKKTPTW